MVHEDLAVSTAESNGITDDLRPISVPVPSLFRDWLVKYVQYPDAGLIAVAGLSLRPKIRVQSSIPAAAREPTGCSSKVYCCHESG